MNIVGLTGSALRVANGASGRRNRRRPDLNCELLEQRKLLSADATTTSISDLTAQTDLSVIAAVSSGPTGLTPAEIRTAYGVNLIAFSGGAVTGTGAGETIAIVDAYNDPNIAADLAAFDSEFGLSAPPSLTVDNLGATTTDAGWSLETSLDVEWAHAIAPRGQHPVGRGRLEQPFQLVQCREFCRQAVGRDRGIDELGLFRISGRIELQ